MYKLINDVETGKTPEHPECQPQRFSLDPHTVLEECEAVARTLKRWTVTGVDVPGRQIEAVYRTFVGFKDDITIRVEDEAEDAVVQMRSRSRLGRSDFGQNARTILEFQSALDEAVRARVQRREPGT